MNSFFEGRLILLNKYLLFRVRDHKPWHCAGALARGDAAILLRFPHKGYREKIWDHAAGVVIVQEAGAVSTDASGDLSHHDSP